VSDAGKSALNRTRAHQDATARSYYLKLQQKGAAAKAAETRREIGMRNPKVIQQTR
jgi:hypothetical protein